MMVRLTKLKIACVAVILSIPGVTFGSIIEVGDLNIIDQAGNASDGLGFLDMTYSDGLSEADALANAKLTYSDARLATAAEFDDLFAAAGIAYDGALTASDAFTIGYSDTISSGGNYDAGTLLGQLGHTTSNSQTFIWSLPDGDSRATSTRDMLRLDTSASYIFNSTASPPDGSIGWLIATQMAPIPEPSSIAMWSALGIIGLAVARRKRKLTRTA